MTFYMGLAIYQKVARISDISGYWSPRGYLSLGIWDRSWAGIYPCNHYSSIWGLQCKIVLGFPSNVTPKQRCQTWVAYQQGESKPWSRFHPQSTTSGGRPLILHVPIAILSIVLPIIFWQQMVREEKFVRYSIQGDGQFCLHIGSPFSLMAWRPDWLFWKRSANG